jgi:carbonic anhydrase/acetyltransferase-like protein (isoleucine patch superfamily)
MSAGRPIILPYNGVWPKIAPTAFVAPGAVIIGDVEISDEASVWFNCTVRGDIAPVRIGARSNVQDNSVLHVNADAPCLIGADVTIGHGAIVHGTTVGDNVMIGMGATVLSYTTIGAGAVVAAGSLVLERMVVDPGAVVMGVPAKVRSNLSEAQQEELRQIPGRYVGVSGTYRAMLAELEGVADGH